MSAELKRSATDCIEYQIDFDEISPNQGSTFCSKLVLAYLAEASPDAILKLIAERDALYAFAMRVCYGEGDSIQSLMAEGKAALALVGGGE